MSSENFIADLSMTRNRLRVLGADRVDFLQGQSTNDIKRLRVGDSCYAAFLNPKGKMRGEGHIMCLENSFLLEVSAGLQATLEKFIITEDVKIEDMSAEMGEWLVVGNSYQPPPADAVTFIHPLGTGVISTTPLVATLSALQLEVLRIEAGVPQWGVDMDETTIPVEAGLSERAISYDKGCYIGQETIARIKTYGHVNRHLMLLAVKTQAGTPVPPGEKLFAADKDVGHVTSAARSNRLGKILALGYVRREFANPGTILSAGGQTLEVIKLCGK